MIVGDRAAPQFADFVAAAARRGAAGDRLTPAFRLAEPLPLPLDLGRDDGLRSAGAPGGYQDFLGLADAVRDKLDGATALAGATRALRRLAEGHGGSVTEIVRDIEITPAERAPARNVARSAPALATTLVLDDDERGLVTVDVYAARVSQGVWEIAAYDRSTATDGGFPYAAPPLLVVHAIVDAVQAQFAAASMLAGAFAPRAESVAGIVARRPALWAGLAFVAILAAFAAAFLASPLAGSGIAVAALVVLRWLDRKSREVGGG